MLFVSENDRRNNIYTLGNLTLGNLRLYLHTFKVFLRYHLICLYIAQTLRVYVHRLAVPTPVCIVYPFILGVFLTTISKRSTVASSLAQATERRGFQSYGFKFERESGRDTSLKLRELVLAYEDMITAFTTTLYFRYGDVTVPRHCGKSFYDILTSHTRLVSSFFSSFVNIKRR